VKTKVVEKVNFEDLSMQGFAEPICWIDAIRFWATHTVKKVKRYFRPQLGCHLPNLPGQGVAGNYSPSPSPRKVWSKQIQESHFKKFTVQHNFLSKYDPRWQMVCGYIYSTHTICTYMNLNVKAVVFLNMRNSIRQIHTPDWFHLKFFSFHE
jgi:hypothetical protein